MDNSHVPSDPGSYILLMELPIPQVISVGKIGDIFFSYGGYVYIGSALNGLKSRIERHLRNEKNHHWHIDYFLQKAKLEDVFYKINTRREECEIAQAFNEEFNGIDKFGCSDCSCSSHLFHGDINKLRVFIDALEFDKWR